MDWRHIIWGVAVGSPPLSTDAISGEVHAVHDEVDESGCGHRPAALRRALARRLQPGPGPDDGRAAEQHLDDGGCAAVAQPGSRCAPDLAHGTSRGIASSSSASRSGNADGGAAAIAAFRVARSWTGPGRPESQRMPRIPADHHHWRPTAARPWHGMPPARRNLENRALALTPGLHGKGHCGKAAQAPIAPGPVPGDDRSSQPTAS